MIWLEQFKRDPFACMRALLAFAHLPPHDYRAIATRNAAGYWVVGKSKSSTKRPRYAHPAAAAALLYDYYAPWQRRLWPLLERHNLSLVHDPPPPRYAPPRNASRAPVPVSVSAASRAGARAGRPARRRRGTVE